MDRSYAKAMEQLTLLQSNRTITSLFDKESSSASSTKDINAAALPEMIFWLRRAGYLPRDLCSMSHIHVAGTKGKGSVCAYATALLVNHHRRQQSSSREGSRRSVGTYTSPHLVSPRERIAIDGEPVSQALFASAFFEVWERLSEAARKEGSSTADADGPQSKPFYFRFLTILAWHIFLTRGVRDVVMECGIGGEYDATNVLPEEAVSAAVVSQLGIDHVAMLGGTVEEIAWHKSGVFKRGVQAFTRRVDDQPNMMEVLRSRAREKGAELMELDDKTVEAWGGVEGGVLKGGFQKYNQALAVMAVRHHLGLDGGVAKSEAPSVLLDTPKAMVEDLKSAKLRGRGEVIDIDNVRWYLDGAHTTDSLKGVASWLSEELEKNGEELVLIFNQQERDVSELLEAFLEAIKTHNNGRSELFAQALFTTNDLESTPEGEARKRDTSVQEKAAATMRRIFPNTDVRIFDNVGDAIEHARILTGCQDGKQGHRKVLVTGSMHLVGAALRTLEPEGLS